MSGGASPTYPPLAQTQAILTIDLRALTDNWRKLRDMAAPAECAAVVKADAYGIGIEPAVRALAKAGCRTFFIAHASEGARVRAALEGAQGFRIFALNGLLPGEGYAQTFIEHGVRPVLGSLAEVRAWLKRGDFRIGQMPVVLHFDTGMNRLGIEARDGAEIARLIREAGAWEFVELVMSHFVSSEIADDPLNNAQIAAFADVRAAFAGKPFSLSNSSGIFLAQTPHYDLVRPGYALYGGNPLPGQPNPMKPVVKLQAPIIQVRDVPAGATVGYNAQWSAKTPARLAVIGLGYADGIPRSAMGTNAKPGGEACIAGKLCPFAGRVSMDLTIIDVSGLPANAVAPGVMAEILGEHISVDDLGERAGTIGYEILTSLGRRYHRVYVEP